MQLVQSNLYNRIPIVLDSMNLQTVSIGIVRLNRISLISEATSLPIKNKLKPTI